MISNIFIEQIERFKVQFCTDILSSNSKLATCGAVFCASWYCDDDKNTIYCAALVEGISICFRHIWSMFCVFIILSVCLSATQTSPLGRMNFKVEQSDADPERLNEYPLKAWAVPGEKHLWDWRRDDSSPWQQSGRTDAALLFCSNHFVNAFFRRSAILSPSPLNLSFCARQPLELPCKTLQTAPRGNVEKDNRWKLL